MTSSQIVDRLIESSSYFRALLGGSFRSAKAHTPLHHFSSLVASEHNTSWTRFLYRCSESGRERVQLRCNLEAAVQVLRYLFEPSESFTITHGNFLQLLEVCTT